MNDNPVDWTRDVLDFWFVELTKKDWYMSSKTLDTTITDRFASIHKKISMHSELPVDATPQMALATVIVLDQFSRNMFRGSKDAFASDELALQFSKQSMARNAHQNMGNDEKQFLFMPFMHSENIDDQKKSVQLFTELGIPEYAVDHLEVITKFGRFPHRNEVLGRKSTAEEIEYLKDAKRYGQ